ncbi:hypothetical protein GCM10010249_20080 [Streptomyces roseolilacinus]|uniref:Uncharacterized protein n=1 Tax=Streptomyces roseolilacinus TaxID=66904 RepID=A0A918B1X7_9ACTN|nr:hypothetical protein GCM10010249_20080 [Streptomyces roseolilacinus]
MDPAGSHATLPPTQGCSLSGLPAASVPAVAVGLQGGVFLEWTPNTEPDFK